MPPSLDLKVPPKLVAVAVALLMFVTAKIIWVGSFDLPHRVVLALTLAALGLCVEIHPKISFVRKGTTVRPRTPGAASALVTVGLYRYSRNPMYLGRYLQLVAWGVYLGSAPALLLTTLFVGYITRYQVLPEEAALESRFGSEYLAYKEAVRRWL